MKKQSFFILIFMIVGIIIIMRTLFGGNKERIGNTDYGLIGQLTKNRNNQYENKNKSNTSGDISNTKVKIIKIVMPKYFYTSGRELFAKDLYKEHNIFIGFIFIDNLNSYRKAISNNELSDANLFLFPYDRNELIQTKNIDLQQSIEKSFDPILATITQNTPITFLPFSLDPIIMYSYLDIIPNNFSTISDTVYNRESSIPSSFPIFFGLTSEDLNNKGFEREYQDIIRYALMHYFETHQDTTSLEIWIDNNIIKDSNDVRNYNIPDLNNILNTISSPACKNFPALCLQIYNFVGIRFGFLSDNDIIKEYFAQKESNFNKLYKNPLPFSTIESPIRIRGLGINSNIADTNTTNAINIFLTKYINEHEKYNLRNSTLSPFQQEGNSLSTNPLIGDKAYILDTGGNYLDALKDNHNFLELIDYKLSAEDHLTNGQY